MKPKRVSGVQAVATKWRWLPTLLVRVVLAFVFIQTGLDRLRDLDRSRDVLNFFWIAVPASHRWDPFFPSAEIVFGSLLALGLMTRVAAVPLLGMLVASIVNSRFKELSGLNLSAFQAFTAMFLLAALCAAGAGSFSLDRFVFRRLVGKAV